jgi:hypothetical protein
MDLHIPADAPDDLYVTEQLDRRRRPADYEAQGKAIQQLAVRMMDEPAGVLPEFVDLAMKITGATSAGLSLLEAGGVRFRWHFLRGRLAPFDGETTPRNFSPCGVTIDRSAVVLARHPERVYDWIDVELAEVLLVPLNVGMGEPVGTLWVATETEDHFTRDDADVLPDLGVCVGATVAEWRRLQPA